MPKRNHEKLISNSAGFTLIEILITLAISGFVMAAIYSIFVDTNRTYRVQESIADTQQRVRVGLGFMVNDIRQIGLDPTASGNFGLELFTTSPNTKLRFTSDLDLNGEVDAPLNQERITYEYDATNRRLRRGCYEETDNEFWQTMLNGVSNLTITCLDANGNTTMNNAEVRQIQIRLTCEGIESDGQDTNRTLTTRIVCRNLYM